MQQRVVDDGGAGDVIQRHAGLRAVENAVLDPRAGYMLHEDRDRAAAHQYARHADALHLPRQQRHAAVRRDGQISHACAVTAQRHASIGGADVHRRFPISGPAQRYAGGNRRRAGVSARRQLHCRSRLCFS